MPLSYQLLCAKARHWLGRYIVVVQVLGIVMAAFLILRLVMLGTFAQAQDVRFSDLAQVLFVGTRLDLLVGLVFIIPQTLHMTVFSNPLVQSRASRLLLEVEWAVAFHFLAFLGIVEFLFFDEFRTRLNYIAFEYLVYPTEVCCNLWQSYALVPLLTAVAASGSGMYIFCRQQLIGHLKENLTWGQRVSFPMSLAGGIACLWLTTGMGSTELSPNRVINECASNGLYSFAYYAWTCRFDFEDFYLTIDPQQAHSRIQRRIVRPADRLQPSDNPLDRTVAARRPRQDRNVVVILEESLGSDFVGVLGDDRQLTPNLDALAAEGMLFDNFYATGNRTARALEAILTSLPPLPTESILKRDHSEHVYTLADVLAKRGYERLFMTGGRGIFDGVRSFMTSNGFNHFVEQNDFSTPVFTNAWGVSDEDLLQRALTELDGLHANGSPFLAVILTVSNHRPFTFPSGRIAEREPTRENAVKYADWALGQFFMHVRTRPYFDDTLFVVMGDHGARVYGSQLFPMQSYRVPMLMIGPEGVVGKRCSTLGSSIDVAPTILGLLGGSYRSVFFGRDLLEISPDEGYAVMQHNHDVALLDAKDRLTVLAARKGSLNFRLNRQTFSLEHCNTSDAELISDTASFFQTANRLYYDDRCFPAEPGLSRSPARVLRR